MAAGCYAQVSPEDLEGLPGVVLVLPNARKEGWVREIADVAPAGVDASLQPWPHRTRGLVKVQDGCERGCSYCIVPRARGRERSRPPGEVLRQVERWRGMGAREVVLCGINLGRYGAGPGLDLPRLVRKVLDAGEGFRVRLSSIEPEDLQAAWLAEWSASERVCPHLHLPLQSGDGEILRDMGRGYGPEEYLEAARALRSLWPGASLTTEVMVGYPGESDRAFRHTLEVLEAARPARVHVFRFSRRPGTRAWEKKESVPAAEVERRSSLLLSLAEEWRLRYIEEHEGEARDLLVESMEESYGTGVALGTTEDYLRAFLPHPPRGTLPGDVVSARISGISEGMARLEIKGRVKGGLSCGGASEGGGNHRGRSRQGEQEYR